MQPPRQPAEHRNEAQAAERERWVALGFLPPAPVGGAEKAFVDAVVRAVLDWAGLDEDEADAPGTEPIAPPCRLSAELIGEEALDEFKRRGFRLVGPQA